MDKVLFMEVQRHRQPVLWILFGIISGIVLVSFLLAVIINRNTAALLSFGLAFAVILAIFLVIYHARLTTQVFKDKVTMNFFPFTFTPDVIPLSAVRDFTVVSFQAHKAWGGYGIRYSPEGKAYIMGGDKGVLLTFKEKNKKPILIGSEKAEDLYATLQSVLK